MCPLCLNPWIGISLLFVRVGRVLVGDKFREMGLVIV